MLRGLDLFSGIGGLTLALSEWVKPIAYCELDAYPQGVLLSRMSHGQLPFAPIWDDVTTLRGCYLSNGIDVIYGGFPCQDISVAGNGAGLEGKQSGLFFEILRLIDEIKPPFVFLENVPAIRTRGGERVVKELASRGYDCRWDVVSAEEVGAPHRRQRWFLLALRTDSLCERFEIDEKCYGQKPQSFRKSRSNADELRNIISDPKGSGREARRPVKLEAEGAGTKFSSQVRLMANADSAGQPIIQGSAAETESHRRAVPDHASWWTIEPDVGRVAHGIPARVDRLRGLGNAVVPLQAREAFKRLMGLK